MTAPRITNSLVRVDGITESIPAPFERPRDDMNFAVLELGSDMDVPVWQRRVVDAVASHESLIRDAQRGGASVVLFVESTSSTAVVFDAAFLRILGGADIALEHYASEGA